MDNNITSRFRTSLIGPGKAICIDDLQGVLISRDPLPPGVVFEGIVIYIDEPVETLMSVGPLEIRIRRCEENTIHGQTEKD